jgi:hypothetical protein
MRASGVKWVVAFPAALFNVPLLLFVRVRVPPSSDTMLNIGRDQSDATYRYKMPRLQTKIEGNLGS